MSKKKGSSTLTVAQLRDSCNGQIKKGNGKLKVMISDDIEGNGYHELSHSFIDDSSVIEECCEYDMFHEDIDPKSVILLG